MYILRICYPLRIYTYIRVTLQLDPPFLTTVGYMWKVMGWYLPFLEKKEVIVIQNASKIIDFEKPHILKEAEGNVLKNLKES